MYVLSSFESPCGFEVCLCVKSIVDQELALLESGDSRGFASAVWAVWMLYVGLKEKIDVNKLPTITLMQPLLVIIMCLCC